jgi:hypothetical protein
MVNCILRAGELTDMTGVRKQCWNIYLREDENITYHHRLNALKIARELTEKKFNMIQNGPAIFELKKLEQRVTELRNGLELTP